MLYILAPIFILYFCFSTVVADIPLLFWDAKKFVNFGDYLSLKITEKMVCSPVHVYKKSFAKKGEIKLLALGSIMTFAADGDVIWGSGVNGKCLDETKYMFTKLDIRSVRGPLTRQFLIDNFNIDCPEIYGDPALLFPYLFPEFKKSKYPSDNYIIIPHYSEILFFPKELYGDCVVYPTDPWHYVIRRILNSKFVISSSLHGIIIAEAYGIPAKLLKITDNEPLFKYKDYYYGTNRPYFQFATSVEEALNMGGEAPFECDLESLYHAFPFEFWPNTTHCKRELKVL